MMNVSSSGSTGLSGSNKNWSTRSALLGNSTDDVVSTSPSTSPTDFDSGLSTPPFQAKSDVVTTPVAPSAMPNTDGGYGGVPPHFVPSGGNLATPPDDDQGLKTPMRKKSKLIPALAGLAMLLAVVGGGAALYMTQQESGQDLRQRASEGGVEDVTCTSFDLRLYEPAKPGQAESDPQTWTAIQNNHSVPAGSKVAYKPKSCTPAGWEPGLRNTYDLGDDPFSSTTSSWCATGSNWCKIDVTAGTLYFRSNLKKQLTIDNQLYQYWCKHDGSWVRQQLPGGAATTVTAPTGFRCGLGDTRAHAQLTVTGESGLCYSLSDGCATLNTANCQKRDRYNQSDLEKCQEVARSLRCSKDDQHIVIKPRNETDLTGPNPARGWWLNGKYYSGYTITRLNSSITSVSYKGLTFQCANGPSDAAGSGACDQNKGYVGENTVTFGNNDSVNVVLEYTPPLGRCGALQVDMYDIKINGALCTTSGHVYGVCNKVNSSQMCNLPDDWQNVCPNNSPTPTTIACPPESRINLEEPTVALDAQNKLVVSWTAPAPNPSPMEQYVITRVKRPISATTPTPTWAPVESVVGPVLANSSRLTKVGTTLSYTDTTNSATCGFVYRYQLRAYNTTDWNVGRDSLCNVLKQTELSVPCTGESPTPTPTVTPTGVLTATPTPTTTIACNSPCTEDQQCKAVNSNYVCSIEHGNRCRMEGNRNSTSCEGVGATNTPTPVTAIGCNQACSTNSDCSNPSHICYQTSSGSKVCRLDTNVESVTCSSAVAEQPNLPPALPQTGPEDWALWLKAGLVTLGLGAALLLLL